MTQEPYVWIVTEQALEADNVPPGALGLKLFNSTNEEAHIHDSLCVIYFDSENYQTRRRVVIIFASRVIVGYTVSYHFRHVMVAGLKEMYENEKIYPAPTDCNNTGEAWKTGDTFFR